MALPRGNFGRGAGGNQIEIQIIDDDFCIVFGAPLLGEAVVEPLVVSGNKMSPLQNPECFRGACGLDVNEWTNGCDACRSFDNVAAR